MSITTPDLSALWEEIILEIAKEVPKSKLLTWFQDSALLSVEDNIATVATAREFYLSFLQKNAQPYVIKILSKNFPDLEKVDYIVDGTLENKSDLRSVNITQLLSSVDDPEKKSVPKSRKLPNQSEVKISSKEGETFISKTLDANYTLRNFVIGSENQLAHAACQAVADAPGGAYNPLFIYGSVGLGKTHLLQSIANEILRKNPRALVVYLTTENFIAEVVDAIQKRKMEKIRQKYRKVDVFILDDIQFLAGKDRTQEIFFHLFNDLYAGKKQMIFSSDRPPMELELTEDRLKSRFSMGMIADVKFPDYETRLAIVKVKARESGIMLSEEVLNFIALNTHHSIREMQGVILQTKAQIELQGIDPTVQTIAAFIQNQDRSKEILGIRSRHSTRPMAMEEIVDEVSRYYSVQATDVIGSSRSRIFMIPRQVSMFLIKKHLSVPLKSIGQFFSGRDHTSVMHALKKVEKMRKEDPSFWKELNLVEQEIGF